MYLQSIIILLVYIISTLSVIWATGTLIKQIDMNETTKIQMFILLAIGETTIIALVTLRQI